MLNNCCNERLQTSSLQTCGLLTFLASILCITGYVEYCSNVFIGKMLKLNADELKRLLIKAWFGTLASCKVSLIRQLTNGKFNLMHVSQPKHFENML